jgi:DNA-3-methyladenine glycosylase I
MVEQLLQNPGVIRNRLKIVSAIENARAALAVQQEFGSLDRYLWSFVGGRPRTNHWRTHQEVPARTPEAETMSRDLIRRGFRFVGPTICYAFMQAVGMANDHVADCFRHAEIRRLTA